MSEPKQIGNMVKQLESSFKLDTRVRPEPTPPNYPELLMQRGFPRRHVRKLGDGELDGPALAKARSLLPAVNRDGILLLIGPRGTGKTQIATYWADHLLRKGAGVIYTKTVDLISAIQSSWRTKQSEDVVLKKPRQARYLVLDEFQERGESDWEARVLVNLIDHRYDEELVTVLIANYSEDEAMRSISPSILSRASESGGKIICDWQSYRV